MDDLSRMDLHDTKIGKIIKNRNIKVILTSIIVFVIGVFLIVPAINTFNYFQIFICLVLIGSACYGVYLFYIRTTDLYNHPDIQKFLSFKNSDHYIKLFENEISGTLTSYNGFIDTNHLTHSFVIIDSFYRFRWIYFTEIMWVYRKNT